MPPENGWYWIADKNFENIDPQYFDVKNGYFDCLKCAWSKIVKIKILIESGHHFAGPIIPPRPKLIQTL